MKKLVCELCGSNSFTKLDAFFVCDYCRTKYSPAEAQKLVLSGSVSIDRSGEFDNFIHLAKVALNARNGSEAATYATRAIEINSRHSEAWWIKAKAAGTQSTITDFRDHEMLSGFVTAMHLAAPDVVEPVKRNSAAHVVNVSSQLFNHSWQEVAANANYLTWNRHIQLCDRLVAAIQVSYQWVPDVLPLNNIVTIAHNLISGVRDRTSSNGIVDLHLDHTAEARMYDLLDKTSVEMRKFNPSFVLQEPRSGRTGKYRGQGRFF